MSSAPAKKQEEMTGMSHQSSAAQLLHAHLHVGYSDVNELQKNNKSRRVQMDLWMIKSTQGVIEVGAESLEIQRKPGISRHPLRTLS